MKRFFLVLFLMVWLNPVSAFAIGEVFKIEATGKEYCGDYDVVKINADNNVDLWIRIDSATQLTVSFTPDFTPGTTFPIIGETYWINSKSAAFVGGQLFEGWAYVTIQGTATINKFGDVTKLKGTFIQNGLIYDGCFSSGKFVTTQRLY